MSESIVQGCGNCRFSMYSVIQEGPVTECRRFPPTTFPDTPSIEDIDLNGISIEVDDDEIGWAVSEFSVHRFPVVGTSDWCGEWQPNEGVQP